ncbi:hypothetical protein [Phenylobacterium sp.]|jgi:hypothetical protein|uniref:hypothetical protein n=1 Tax=Phenylobacterium sp. TaxID=1871053 RepID=UPI002F411F65
MKLASFAVLASSMAFIAAPTAVLAAPVYLVCLFSSPDMPEEEDYTLNEQAGTITYTGPGTYTPTFRAAFTPDRVVFRNQLLTTYTFNRVDLSVAVKNTSGAGMDVRGQCKLRTPPAKRAF